LALDGLKLSANAAKDWSGTVADLRQKKEKLEEKVTTLLAAHTRADREGETSSTADQPSDQDKVHEQIHRLERQAARLEKFLAEHAPKRGKDWQGFQVPVQMPLILGFH
jgi:hypothetical protein